MAKREEAPAVARFSISAPFIRRPIATTLLMAALLLVGAAAFPFLPVASLPNADIPTLEVSANFAGASPETMASAVATPLEQQFALIPGIGEMTSISTLGAAEITLQFALDRNVDLAAADVQAAINAASGQLPKDLPSPPTYRKVNPADAPILLLALQSSTMKLTAVDDYAENVLLQRLSQIEGVGQVSVGGQQKPAVRVQVDPARLASRGMTMEDVRSQLADATVDSPKGSIDGAGRSYVIGANDQLTKAAGYNGVVLAYRNGAVVRVRDIGHAVDGPQNREVAAWQETTPSIILIIFKQPGANVIATVDRVKAALPKLEASMPAGIEVSTILDRTLSIRASVADVERSLAFSIALVVLVIFLFLRNLRATLIPSVTVPLALLATAAVMYLCNYSLDNLSLMGLTIAVGFVVDDAIVMLENIFRYIEEGMSPREAALKGASEIGFTIVSITVSLVAVFIPLLAMGGVVGRLLREFAMVVTIAVLFSAVISLTLTPMLCGLFLRRETRQPGRFYRAVEGAFEALLGFYERTLDVALRFRVVTLLVFSATVALSVVLYVIMPKGFFPQQDTGVITGTSQGAQDISFDAMRTRQLKMAKIIADDPNVQTFADSIGAGGGQTANNGHFFIALKPFGKRALSAQQFIREIRPKLTRIPGMEMFLQSVQDVRIGAHTTRTQYQYTVQDQNGDELNEWAPKLLARMQSMPELRDVATDQQNQGVAATLVIDRDRAGRFGIQPAAIDAVLYDAFGQRQVTQYFTTASSYYVILEVRPDLWGKVSTLSDLYVKSAAGMAVPLSSFVHWDTVHATVLSVNHEGLFPAVTISFNLDPGTSLGQAVAKIRAATGQMGLPESVQTSFEGTAQAFQSSISTEPYLIAAALVAVYIILGVLYESFILPLTILSTLPSAGVGALLLLMVTGNELSVIALIGIILLIGIVKKNGIMMVDFAIEAERQRGKRPLEAIREAALLRFRPILMTTSAALLGGLPLVFAQGSGSELRRPLGIAMVGGLLLSQVLTLYTTPVLYLYLDRLQNYFADRRAAPAPVPMREAAD